MKLDAAYILISVEEIFSIRIQLVATINHEKFRFGLLYRKMLELLISIERVMFKI